MDKPSIHYKWTIFHGYVNQRVISIDYQLAPIRQGSLHILRLASSASSVAERSSAAAATEMMDRSDVRPGVVGLVRLPGWVDD